MKNPEVERQIGVLGERTVDLVSVEELRKKLEKSMAESRPLRIKYGADPSAPDIHLGHVVGLNKLREFQDLGHTVVFLVGDFTGMIGDPSGRSQTRKPLSREQVEENAKSYQKQVFKVLDPGRTEIVFNSQWCAPMTFADVVRLSAHVTVAQMLARDDFAKRYADRQPISVVEFLYPLIQAYDSVVLKADVELGGTDQLFNMLLGRELQKALGQDPQVVLTLPLIEGLDGVNKMSKSLGNYIGITESPQEIFGKVMSVSDDLMWKYFALVLCLPSAEIDALKKRHPREAKDLLAKAIVEKLHEPDAWRRKADLSEPSPWAATFCSTSVSASAEFTRVFSEHGLPADIPEVVVPRSECPEGKSGLVALLVRAGLAASNSEARRLVQQGGVRLDETRITDPKAHVDIRDGAILRAGKRGFARIRLS